MIAGPASARHRATGGVSPATGGVSPETPERPSATCWKPLLADDQPVMGVSPNGSYVPPSQSASRLAPVAPELPSRPGADNQNWHVGQPGAIDGRSLRGSRALPCPIHAFLAEQVLQPDHVVDREIAVLALELLGQRLPADVISAVDVGDLAQLVRSDGRAQVARGARCRAG